MNTIKLFLSTAGRTARCDKNFPLYCGQFQNVLLNIFVPTAILAPNFEIQHFIGNYKYSLATTDPDLQARLDDFVLEQTARLTEAGDVIFYTYTGTGTFYRATYNGTAWVFVEVPYFTMGDFAGTNVKTGVIATEPNGTQYKSKSYYCRYVKTLTSSADGIEYAMYERKMPREFTAFIGSGQAARTVVINVTNTNEDKVENIVTSQTVGLDVLPSTQLDGDEPLEASDKDEIWAEINEITADLSEKQDIRPVHLEDDTEVSDLDTQANTIVGAINEVEDKKQNKTDSGLDTTNKTVVGAINELEDKKQNKTDNSLLTEDKTIVGAINEVDAHADAANAQAGENAQEITSLKGRMDDVELVAAGAASQAETNRQDIADLKPRMTAVESTADAANQRSIANAQEIANIESIIGTGEDFIGTLTIDYDPTWPANYTQLASDLADFVQDQAGRAPKGGDSVIIVEEVAGQTDRNFKYIYTGTEWHGYEIPPMELASYNSAGLVSGTYRVTSPQTPQEKNYDTLVYIDGGEIKNIYIKIDGAYEDFRTVILGIIGSFSNIVSGATPVGEAQVANKDSAGNNIATQFANILSGASKVGAAASADAATAATNDGAGNNIALQFANILSGATKVGASAAADAAEVATKDSAGNNIATQFANILSGVTQVGSAAYAAAALKATQDALGNNIVDTYLTKSFGATKQYVKDYALPKEFNDVLYVSAGGFVEEIPTTPASGVQFSETSSAIGETVIATCDYTLGDLKFQLARKNSYTARYYIQAGTNTNEVLQFKLSTYAIINNVQVLLHAELTTPKLIPATLTNFDFGEAFAELDDNVLELVEGDKIRQVLSVVRENSNSVTFDVYSDATYPSSFYLNTTLEVGVKMVRRASQAFTLYSNGWSAAANISPYEYNAVLQLPFDLDENSYVELIVDPIIAAKYGFVIGSAQNDTVTFYAVNEPTENINLKLIIDNLGTLNDLEDNYAFGYTFYLRNADIVQSNSNAEVGE